MSKGCYSLKMTAQNDADGRCLRILFNAVSRSDWSEFATIVPQESLLALAESLTKEAAEAAKGEMMTKRYVSGTVDGHFQSNCGASAGVIIEDRTRNAGAEAWFAKHYPVIYELVPVSLGQMAAKEKP